MSRKPLLLIVIVYIFVSCYSNPSLSEAEENKQTAQVNPSLRPGMSKGEIYQIYPPTYQEKYYKKDNLEIIVFDDYLTKEAGDIITFYLKDGKLQWWDKEPESQDPEDRLKAIKEREIRSENMQLPADKNKKEVEQIKERVRRDDINPGAKDDKKYFKTEYKY